MWGWPCVRPTFPQAWDSWGYSCLSEYSNYVRKDIQLGFPGPRSRSGKGRREGAGTKCWGLKQIGGENKSFHVLRTSDLWQKCTSSSLVLCIFILVFLSPSSAPFLGVSIPAFGQSLLKLSTHGLHPSHPMLSWPKLLMLPIHNLCYLRPLGSSWKR